MTKSISNYDSSPQLIKAKTLPIPPKSSITIISVEDMIEKHLEVLEPTRFSTKMIESESISAIDDNLTIVIVDDNITEENLTKDLEIEKSLDKMTKKLPTKEELEVIAKEQLKREQAKKYPKYSVSKGDTLHSIAKRYKLKIKDILEWNSLKNKSKIRLGQKITLPLSRYTYKILTTMYRKKKLAEEKRKLELKKKMRLESKLYPSRNKQMQYKVDSATYSRQLRVQATAYTSHRRQTDRTPFLAAWNNRLRPGVKSIAVSRDLIRKYGIGNGKRVRISGLPGTYIVKDKMNKRFRKRIDIYMGLNRRKALRWGRRNVTIFW
jgi:LysM repeat protein